jgi:uncharacterized membrane protein/acyl-CoA synthetase (AMP-forming)/AMP-acid ligase II
MIAIQVPKRFALNILVVPLIAFIIFFTKEFLFLRFYPVFINTLMLCTFGITFIIPPVMIFRFALLQDKTLNTSPQKDRVYRYCVTVTLIWCLFFAANGAFALFTVLSENNKLWLIYNGFISYILLGILFFGEMIVRKKVIQKQTTHHIPISKLNATSRDADTIICYDGVFSEGVHKTWNDFLTETKRMRIFIQSHTNTKWLLYSEDAWFFLVSFTALLQCKKTVLLSANTSHSYISEIRDGETAFLNDMHFDNSFDIAQILCTEANQNTHGTFDENCSITADDTKIILFTSGSTGKPKPVEQRLTELENDNAYILSKWGDKIASHYFCATVSHHHIFGLLFSLMLPFSAGVPFRRKRIDFPAEFEKMNDVPYMIISVPAFLKRVTDMDTHFNLKEPFIWTSGGSVPLEVAKKTNETFGCWPLEVYGSTETSGIAYRFSKDGEQWTVFDNASIWLDEGCLAIRSPYIKDKSGFTTGDMAEILSDGRFLLKGRADSVVKIEEKRISLPEVEERLLQSNLISDVSVIALEDRRQYLAAVIVFNKDGKEKFNGAQKLEINRFFTEYLLQFFEAIVLPKKWRYVEKIPTNEQGKKAIENIKALFVGGAGV